MSALPPRAPTRPRPLDLPGDRLQVMAEETKSPMRGGLGTPGSFPLSTPDTEAAAEGARPGLGAKPGPGLGAEPGAGAGAGAAAGAAAQPFDGKVLGMEPTHPLRTFLLHVVLHPAFDWAVLLLILINSTFLGCIDYRCVDRENGAPDTEPSIAADTGEPYFPDDCEGDSRERNLLFLSTEKPFDVIFLVELLVKMLALGPVTYFRDRWNWIDFIVTFFGAVNLGASGYFANLVVIRAVRALKPLRSLSKIQELQVLTLSVLSAIPGLISVIWVLGLLYFVFGVVGVELYIGKLNARCRLTPYPVLHTWTPDLDPAAFACLPAANGSDPSDNNFNFPDAALDSSDSPWSTGRLCWWPQDTEDERNCALDVITAVDPGYDCGFEDGSVAYGGETYTFARTCGSNFDGYGNPRFLGGFIAFFNRSLSTAELMARPTYLPSKNYGYTDFDNIFSALVTIVQVNSLEGWANIMLNTMDATSPFLSGLFYVLLVLAGAFIVINLVLAVLEASFTQTKRQLKSHKILERNEKRKRERHFLEQETARAHRRRGSFFDASLPPPTKAPPPPSCADAWSRLVGNPLEDRDIPLLCPAAGGEPAFKAHLRAVLRSRWFSHAIMGLVVLNFSVLALDRHPIRAQEVHAYQLLNAFFTALFALEVLSKMYAFGLLRFLEEDSAGARWAAFDALVTLVSVVQLLIFPPVLFGGDTDHTSSASALRVFRLFRLFRAFRRLEKLQALLAKTLKAFARVSSIVVLLALVVYIYALLGMSLFANRLRFDADTDRPVGLRDARWEDAAVPRANFDTLDKAVVTLFIVLTGEDWTGVMYDCWRAAGASAPFFFFTFMLFGQLFIVDLLVAVLISTFETGGRGQPPAAGPKGGGAPGEKGGGARAAPRGPGGAGKGGAGTGAPRRPLSVLGPQSTEWVDGDVVFSGYRAGDLEGGPAALDWGGAAPRQDSARSLPAGSSSLAERKAAFKRRLGRSKTSDLDRTPTPLSKAPRPRGSPPPAAPAADAAPPAAARLTEDAVRIHEASFESKRSADDVYVAVDDIFQAQRQERRPSSGSRRSSQRLSPSQRGSAGGASPPPQPLRDLCSRAASSAPFVLASTCSILLATLVAVLDSPLNDPDSAGTKALRACDLLVTGLFATEAAVKVLAMGLLLPRRDPPPESLRGWWRRLQGGPFAPAAAAEAARSAPGGARGGRAPGRGASLGSAASARSLAAAAPALSRRSPSIGGASSGGRSSRPQPSSLSRRGRDGEVVDGSVAYLSDGWNRLDLFIVATSIVGSLLLFGTASSGDLTALKAFRALRALRPLALVKTHPQLRLVVKALFASAPDVLNLCLIILCVFTVFAILFTSELKGQLRRCAGGTFEEHVRGSAYEALLLDPVPLSELPEAEAEALFGDPGFFDAGSAACEALLYAASGKQYCLCLGGEWRRAVPQSFDNVVSSLLSLLEMSTTEGWADVLFAAADSRGVDAQPEEDANWSSGVPLLFVLFMLLGSFFAVNAFIGVVYDNFVRKKREAERDGGFSSLVTPEQKRWIDVVTMGSTFRPKRLEPGRPVLRSADAQLSPTATAVTSRSSWFGVVDQVTRQLGTRPPLAPSMAAEAEAEAEAEGPAAGAPATPASSRPGLSQRLSAESVSTDGRPSAASPAARRGAGAGPAWAWLRRRCLKLSQQRLFSAFIMLCIFLNCAVLACQFYGQSDLYGAVLEGLNFAFLCVFVLEAAVKAAGSGLAGYLGDPWNRFDLLLVLAGVASAAVRAAEGGITYFRGFRDAGSFSTGLTTALRALRVARALRIIRGAGRIRQMVNTLVRTAPALVNVGGLLLLLIFVFAVVGVQLFAKVGFRGIHGPRLNFRNVHTGMLTLLRFATGENWNEFMHALSGDAPGCVDDPPYDERVCYFEGFYLKRENGCEPLNGCGTPLIFPYMLLYIVCALVVVNLLIGAVLQSFDDARKANEEIERALASGEMYQFDFKEFQDAWSNYDPNATSYISVGDLKRLLQHLRPPWGFGERHRASERELNRKLRELEIRLYEGFYVHFVDVLAALSRNSFLEEALSRGEGDHMRQPPHPEDAPAVRTLLRNVDEIIRATDNYRPPVLGAAGEPYTCSHYIAMELLCRSPWFQRLRQRRRQHRPRRQTSLRFSALNINLGGIRSSITAGLGFAPRRSHAVSATPREELELQSPIAHKRSKSLPVSNTNTESELGGSSPTVDRVASHGGLAAYASRSAEHSSGEAADGAISLTNAASVEDMLYARRSGGDSV